MYGAWSGSPPDVYTMLDNPTQTIDSIVTDIFAKYPVPAADAVQ
jgi:hypothetical protein